MSDIQWRQVTPEQNPQAYEKFDDVVEANLTDLLVIVLGMGKPQQHPLEPDRIVTPVVFVYSIPTPLGAVRLKSGVLAEDISMDEAKKMAEENWAQVPQENKDKLTNVSPLALLALALRQQRGEEPLGNVPLPVEESDDPSDYTVEASG